MKYELTRMIQEAKDKPFAEKFRKLALQIRFKLKHPGYEYMERIIRNTREDTFSTTTVDDVMSHTRPIEDDQETYNELLQYCTEDSIEKITFFLAFDNDCLAFLTIVDGVLVLSYKSARVVLNTTHKEVLIQSRAPELMEVHTTQYPEEFIFQVSLINQVAAESVQKVLQYFNLLNNKFFTAEGIDLATVPEV